MVAQSSARPGRCELPLYILFVPFTTPPKEGEADVILLFTGQSGEK